MLEEIKYFNVKDGLGLRLLLKAGIEVVIVSGRKSKAVDFRGRDLGIQEIYRVGGAQAVAALAYGVDGMAKVDKIVGAGNLFVTLAKQQLYGVVGMDGLAGSCSWPCRRPA